jgi:hypothetical protein
MKKDRNQNSRIKFQNFQISIIKNSLQHWIDIDLEKFGGLGVEKVKSVLDFIKLKTLQIKNEYTLNLDCEQMLCIHGAVAEDYLDYKIIEKDVAMKICNDIEGIVRKNYQLCVIDIVHPTHEWK